MAGFSKLAAKAVKKPLAQAATELFDAGTAEVNKREDQHRDKNTFHISSVGYCMKSVYLDRIHGKEQDLSFLRKVNYGTKIHELYQKYLAASGKLFGMYYCKLCGKTWGPQYGGVCEECVSDKPLEYSEIHLINSKLKVSGHPDGFLSINGKIALIEIKTITGFSKIASGPQVVDVKVPEHKHQTNFYLHVLQHPSTLFKGVDRDLFLANLNTEEYLMMYHDKGSDAMVPYAFPASKEMFEKDVARIADYFECVKAGREPRPEVGLLKCRYCNWVSQCSGLVTC